MRTSTRSGVWTIDEPRVRKHRAKQIRRDGAGEGVIGSHIRPNTYAGGACVLKFR